MSGYSTHWRATIFAAIILHFAAALGFSYVLPKFAPSPTINDVTELEWIDVDLTDDVTVIDEEAIPSDTPQETLPTFDAKDLFVPELTIPESIIEPIQTPLPEVKPIELPQREKVLKHVSAEKIPLLQQESFQAKILDATEKFLPRELAGKFLRQESSDEILARKKFWATVDKLIPAKLKLWQKEECKKIIVRYAGGNRLWRS